MERFHEVIALAKQCPPPAETESDAHCGRFARFEQVFALADQVVDAVRAVH